MLRTARAAGWAAILLPLLVLVPAAPARASHAGAATVSGDGAFCRTPVDYTVAGGGGATVNRFAVGNHENEAVRYDRVVIGLDRPAASYRVRYVPQLIQDGSGLPVELRGAVDLEVVVEGASAHDDEGRSTVPVRRYLRDWGSLREARLFSDFEATVLVGIGLARTVDFRVFTLTNPHRLVVDVALPGEHPWRCNSGAVKVFFLDEQRVVDNIEPYFVPVWRRVSTPAVAGGALSSLFHGPLVTEFDRGLRLVSSEATGFTGLRITDRIAHVRLTGGCNSGGSTITVAGSIIPTLKQFSSVDYVKIYDPAGQTGDPTGRSDSIPDCLNP